MRLQLVATLALFALLLTPAWATAGADTPHGVLVGANDVIDAVVDSSADLDTYVFDAVAGSTLRVAARPGRGSALDPQLVLVGPGGTLVPTVASERRKGRNVRWKKVLLPSTGRYAVGVRSRAGSAGAYRLTLATRTPRSYRFRDLAIGAGADADLTYAAVPGSRARVTLRADAGFEIVSLRGTVDDASAFAWKQRGFCAVATLEHGATLEDRAVRLRAGATPLSLDVRIRIRDGDVPRRRVAIARAEPVIAAIQPENALPGSRVAIVGAGFLVAPEEPVVLFGDVRGIDAVAISSERIEVTVPAASGAAMVRVFDIDGLDAWAPRAFLFDAQPPSGGGSGTTALVGIVGHWDFTASAGPSVLDFSGNGSTGVSTGTATLGATGVQLAGDTSHVFYETTTGAPPPSLGALTSGTITVRFRYDDVTNGEAVADCLPLVYYGVGPGAVARDQLDSLAVYIGHTGIDQLDRRQIYLTIVKDEGVQLCFDSGDISLEAGRWYHYAATIAPGAHHGYLDGVEFERRYNSGTSLASDAFFATVEPRAERFTVGHGMLGYTRQFWSFNGAIAEVRIYGRVLSAPEIAALARHNTVE